MPRISSILFSNDSKEYLQKLGCCQFLHTTSEMMTGLIPLKYLYNHKDISKKFKNWMKFLNDDLELDIEYTIEDREVEGWKSLQHFADVYEKQKVKYLIPAPPANVHKGVFDRVTEGNYQIIQNKRIIIAPYNSGSLTAPPKPNQGSGYLYDRTDLPKFTIPVALTKLPTKLAPEHNSFKYVAWYMIRFYISYQHLANFLLDNREELEELMKKFNLGWWNIVFAIFRNLPMSHFGCHTLKKIMKVDLAAAFEKEAVNISNTKGEPFKYTKHEIYISGAMEKYCGKTTSYTTAFNNLIEPFTDSPSGHITTKESIMLVKHLNSYYSNLKEV